MPKVNVDEIILKQAKTGKKSKYFTFDGVKYYPDAIMLDQWNDLVDINISTEEKTAFKDDAERDAAAEDPKVRPSGEKYIAGNIDGYTTMTKLLAKAEFKGKLNKIEREYGITATQSAGAKAAADVV